MGNIDVRGVIKETGGLQEERKVLGELVIAWSHLGWAKEFFPKKVTFKQKPER